MSAYKELLRTDKVDILVSNPPYIASHDIQVEENVKKFEPSSALFAEDNGLALLKEWSHIYSRHMNAPRNYVDGNGNVPRACHA